MWRLSELTRRANSTSVSRGFGGNFGFQLLAQLEALLGVPNHAFSLRKSLSAVWCYPAPTVGFAGDTSRPLWESSSGCHCWSAFKGENSWDIPRIKKQLWNDLTLYSHSSHQRLLPSFGGKWCLTPTALSSRKVIDGKKIPGCKAPMGSITALIFLRSVNILHLPDFFFTTKTGEFQGLVDSIICPCSLCSSISSYNASNFSLVKGHCSIYMGFSESQVSFNAVFFEAVAPRINLDFGKGYTPYWP